MVRRCVADDRLQQFDVCSFGDQGRDGEVAQIVEPKGQASAGERGPKLAPHEVARIERCTDKCGEDEVMRSREAGTELGLRSAFLADSNRGTYRSAASVFVPEIEPAACH
jgi:hypothetical protein